MAETMRAVVMERRGTVSEALVYHTDWPVPKAKPNQVLVKAAATSMNAGEWKMRSGFAPIPLKLPKILGEDLAGIVVEAPQGSKFKKGDRVFGGTDQTLRSDDRFGTNAEYVAVDEDKLCLVPDGVSLQEAAAVPVAGLTAWQGLEPGFPLQGKKVLIHGGAGGVGGFAVQIAKAHEAHVTTTCSGSKVDYVKTLGADVAIDYTQGPWEASLAGQQFDVILDVIGGRYEAASLRLLKRGGVLCTFGATGPDVERVSVFGMVALLLNAGVRTLRGRLRLGSKYKFVMMDSRASRGLEQLAELMAQGKLKVHLDSVFPLEELAKAHEALESGRVRGKVGIVIDPSLQ